MSAEGGPPAVLPIKPSMKLRARILLRRLARVFRRPKIIHAKSRPRGATAVAVLLLGMAILALWMEAPPLRAGEARPPPLAVAALLLVTGVGLLRRWRWSFFLALGLTAAGAAGSGVALLLRVPLPGLEGASQWGWLLALWYCLLAFFYLRQRKVADAF